ncbi:hypothetical protein GYA28_02145 [Candidatus Roizmanbacteria bacterium]|jgi:hypothetical protein|nr:hypothetical protein [Candidatus Roizmanbacteria bacterium]
MRLINKVLVGSFILLLAVIAYEFKLYYLTPGAKTKDARLYSLNTVKEQSKFFDWLYNNNLITRSKFEVDKDGLPLITNDTEGSIKSLSLNKKQEGNDEVLLALQTKSGLVNFVFPANMLEFYTKERKLVHMDSMAKEENVIVHEVFGLNKNTIVPLNIKIVKN